jgi:hypothetical protein
VLLLLLLLLLLTAVVVVVVGSQMRGFCWRVNVIIMLVVVVVVAVVGIVNSIQVDGIIALLLMMNPSDKSMIVMLP